MIQELLRLRLHIQTGILMRLVARDGGDALHEIENAFRRAAFLRQHLSITLAVSALEKPRRRRNSVRSSSLRATICSRAALMPLTKGVAEELAKFSSAGAAS